MAGLLAFELLDADFRLAVALVVGFVTVGTNSLSSSGFRLRRICLPCAVPELRLGSSLPFLTRVGATDVACDVSSELGTSGISKTSVCSRICCEALCLVACDTFCSFPLLYVTRFNAALPGTAPVVGEVGLPTGSGASMACVD